MDWRSMAETRGVTSSTRLPDGRTLGLIEYGVPDGAPLLPRLPRFSRPAVSPTPRSDSAFDSSALTGREWASRRSSQLAARGLARRRRGVGGPSRDRSFLGGWSLGRRTTCAYRIPDRLTGCDIVAGPGPVGGWRFLGGRGLVGRRVSIVAEQAGLPIHEQRYPAPSGDRTGTHSFDLTRVKVCDRRGGARSLPFRAFGDAFGGWPGCSSHRSTAAVHWQTSTVVCDNAGIGGRLPAQQTCRDTRAAGTRRSTWNTPPVKAR